MQNATIPESEKHKMNQKMKFQMKHNDLLSMPKQSLVRAKFDDYNEDI